MLLIGIDEAGYGPTLGPLCHGYCAFRCAHAERGEPPDLWDTLHPSVRRHSAGGDGIIVDDSKRVYAAGQGLDGLAHGVSAFLVAQAVSLRDPSRDREGAVPFSSSQEGADSLYLPLLPSSDRARLEEDEWGQSVPGASRPCPPTDPSRARQQAVLGTLVAQGISVVAYGARALSAKHFNAALRTHGNKADVSWSVIAGELRRLLALAAPGEHVHAVIDRQGGRKFYSAHVAALFPGALPWVEEEQPHASVYQIETNGACARLAFLVKADSASFPVALASMAAKLARELCMARLNAFFLRHLPALKPTAGYAADAKRFLSETSAWRRKLGIDDGALVRMK